MRGAANLRRVIQWRVAGTESATVFWRELLAKMEIISWC